jgi:hypothetical protein
MAHTNKTCSVGDSDQPAAPAKQHAGHRRDRPLGGQAGAKLAWRNIAEHPLSAAFERGQLSRGGDMHSAKDRFNAGEFYRRIYEGAQVRSRDSTQLEVVLGGTGAGMGEARADARAGPPPPRRATQIDFRRFSDEDSR